MAEFAGVVDAGVVLRCFIEDHVRCCEMIVPNLDTPSEQ